MKRAPRTHKADLPRYHETIRSLLREGKDMQAIANLLHKDRTTILYAVREHRLKPDDYVSKNEWRKRTKSVAVTVEANGEVVNTGKDYKDYLSEQKDRRYNKLIGITK